jgi:hypothetical protein
MTARSGDTFENKDVQHIIERDQDQKGNGLLKCKLCGVKFDNPDALEGHIAAGHISLNNPTEDRPSGLGHLTKDPYICDICARTFPNIEDYNTHRLQH